jgi:hypothetical protein
MDETPLYKRPWFYIAAWLTILVVVYGWQIVRMGGFRANLRDIFIDLAIVFPLLLLLWLAFFCAICAPGTHRYRPPQDFRQAHPIPFWSARSGFVR